MPEILKLVRQAFRALHYLVDVAELGQVERLLGPFPIVLDCSLPELSDVGRLCRVECRLGSHGGASVKDECWSEIELVSGGYVNDVVWTWTQESQYLMSQHGPAAHLLYRGAELG